jgi:TM2 domain-containing membrane protein YozV
MAFCANCGSPIQDGIKFCAGCGKAVTDAPNGQAAPTVHPQVQSQVTAAQTQSTKAYPPGYVPKEWLIALLLCIFLGCGHRFYVGKVGTGILMAVLIIIGWLGTLVWPLLIVLLGYFVWWLIDLIYICKGKFTDAKGFALKKD